MSRLALVVAIAAAAGCGGLGKSHWIGYACELSIAPQHDALAYHDQDAHRLMLRRDDGDHPLAYPTCVGDGKDIAGVVALADGWRALVYGYSVSGGNGFEHGEIDSDFACIVDFRTGATTDVYSNILSTDLRHFRSTVGMTTGWVYNHEIASPVRVIDLATGKFAELEGAGETIVELGSTARTIVAELVETGHDQPRYKSTLIVQDYDTTTWPPAPREPRRIPVNGRTDTVAISADGRWASYTGDMLGESYDLGLVDLEAGAIAFEQLGQPGDMDVGEVLASGDAVWLLVVSSPMAFSDRVYTARWLDRNGAAVGASKSLGSDYTMDLTWLPGRRRVAADGSCAVDLLDLPPPVK